MTGAAVAQLVLMARNNACANELLSAACARLGFYLDFGRAPAAVRWFPSLQE